MKMPSEEPPGRFSDAPRKKREEKDLAIQRRKEEEGTEGLHIHGRRFGPSGDAEPKNAGISVRRSIYSGRGEGRYCRVLGGASSPAKERKVRKFVRRTARDGGGLCIYQ